MSEGEMQGCCAGGGCCAGKLDRRGFMKASMAAGALGLLPASSGAALNPEEEAAFAQWNASLLEPGARRVYAGEELDQIAMPLGGIGCGQLYLGGRGDIVSWQILNNFHFGARVGGPNFAVWARPEGGDAAARLLVEGERDGLPGMESLEFSGEYPYAWIDYHESRAGWPLRVRLESYSPFVPLDPKNSGIPAVVFRFTVENTSPVKVEAALLGCLQNLIGWDGYGTLPRPEHPDFAAHENRVEQQGDTTHLVLGAQDGARHRFDVAVSLATNDKDVAYRARLLGRLWVEHGDGLPAPKKGGREVIWCGDGIDAASVDLREALLRVERGAGLIIAGGDKGVLAASAQGHAPRRAETFEDWERGHYEAWALEGDAFGDAPASGTLPGQQTVTGFHGKRLFNSFFNGDTTTGVAKSRAFKLRHKHIHLLVGGGHYDRETCINLVDDSGYVVRTAHGDDTEQLKPVVWDVEVLLGQHLHFEIVDQRKDGWGHVLVDDIIFSDSGLSPFATATLPREVREALPARWRRLSYQDEPMGIAAPETLHAALTGAELRTEKSWKVRGLKLTEDAEILLKDIAGNPLVIAGTHGKGRIVLCMGDPMQWGKWQGEDSDRRLIAALIARAAGCEYLPAQFGDMAGLAPEDTIAAMPHHGSMALSARGGEVTACGQWNDFAAVWKDFAATGTLPVSASGPGAPGAAWNGALASRVTLAPGESREVEFTIAWHFPNRMRTAHYGWGPKAFQYDFRLGNHYNTVFPDALAVSRYMAEQRDMLAAGTRTFHETFYSTTAPRYFLDAITANIATLRSPIYVWLEDGTVGGFEGTDSCCPMNCTHVYNYAMTMPYLFPELERNVRELDLLVNKHPVEHYVPHRTALPLSEPRLGNDIGGPQHHALDGELGAILKLYREWKICGDREWLSRVWPPAKLVMEHVLRDHDVDGDGVLKGEQPNTYDTHLFGSNMFIGGLYLGALRATEELAHLVGDDAFAKLMRDRYERGARGYDALCWNGEYYYNVFNAPGVDPQVYNANNCYGPGCHADQVLGQWWAHHLGLGHLCDAGRSREMLAAIHRYNWRNTLRDHHHNQRVFAEGDEKGLLIVTWPKGGRPDPAILYCDEVWTGIEYEVAGAMLHEGMVTEALQIVRGARDRYTGNQRNPYSEIECGGHYARAMSAYAMLHAAAGFDYDAGAQRLHIAPRFGRDSFKTFFATGSGWGLISFAQAKERTRVKIEVRAGMLSVAELYTDFAATHVKAVGARGCTVHRQRCGSVVKLSAAVELHPGSPLALVLE